MWPHSWPIVNFNSSLVNRSTSADVMNTTGASSSNAYVHALTSAASESR
ncbi:MAG: hypothetical protein BWY81_00150 [Firmicutes bacterium ADurb.Bin467]|nr:MAG: hypothetical protein BWY81_00150 [Firmicutes bacterium ADurb.Bin467]